MSHQEVILPNASLFLVDKGWTASHRKKLASVHTNSLGAVTATSQDIKCDVKAIKQSWALQNEKEQVKDDNRNRRCKSTQSFEFVNATRPGRPQDPEVKRLVKSHVKNGIKRGPNSKKKSTSSSGTGQLRVEDHHISSDLHRSPVCGGSSPLYGNSAFPMLFGPRSQALLNYYLYVIAPAWYPLDAHLTYNPVKAGWFPLAMRDEVLFRSILFSSASHLAEGSGSRESIALLMPIFRHLNQRLDADTAPSDTTIAIVTCLAMVEMSMSNYDKWKLHMTGIKEMLRLRGGLCNVAPALQMKIARSDIEGSTDTLTAPILPPLPRTSPYTCSILPDPSFFPSQDSLLTILKKAGISSQLQSILLDLGRLTHALDHSIYHHDVPSIDPRSLDEDIIQIHNAIFMLPSISNIADSLVGIPTTTTSDLNEAVTLASILYVKSLTRPTHVSPIRSRPVIERLISSLSRIHENPNITKMDASESSSISFFPCTLSFKEESPPLPLLLWLFFIGGMTAHHSETAFFTKGIMRLLVKDRKNFNLASQKSWEDVKSMLEEVLWFQFVHDELGKCLWNKALDCVKNR